MPIIRFPNFKRPKLNAKGNFKARIIYVKLMKSEKEEGKTLICITFETIKTGRIITQCFPVNQYYNSLLHQNLRIWLQNDELESFDTNDLFGLVCRIAVVENEKGYPEVRAIPFKKTDSDHSA